jgi:DNA mismatch repair ATPase MutS
MNVWTFVGRDELVLVDDSAWQSLQIFSTDNHPSSVKQGNLSASKEGLSVFSTLNHCSTVQGARSLRLMLLRPSRNITTLNKRYDVIDFCCNTNNSEFVKSATDCLKNIKSFPVSVKKVVFFKMRNAKLLSKFYLQKLLYKLSILHATVVEWKDLYQTVYHCLLLAEICSAQPQWISLFNEVR